MATAWRRHSNCDGHYLLLRRWCPGKLSFYLPQRHLGDTALNGRRWYRQLPLSALLGRLLSASVQHRIGERRTLVFSALLAAAGISVAVATTSATVAIIGILVVGFAIAPIVPTSLSLSARAAPGKSGQAVGLATAIGYGSFILSPVIIGAVATATTLRIGLGTLILTALAMAVVAAKWPKQSPLNLPSSTSPEYQLDEPHP